MSRVERILGVVAMTPKGEYDSSAYYEKLNVVTYNGSSYVALQNTHGNLPTNTTYWQLLAQKGAKTYDNVADMKADTDLKDGMTVQTLGYYQLNDNGGATYKIRTKTNEDIPDDANIIVLLDNTLVAELIKENVMNIKCWGAKGDGITDDTTKLQLALDSYNDFVITDGTYMVNPVTHILIKDNTNIKLFKNAKIKAITTSATNYAIIYLNNVKNILIDGGIVEGDRETHEGDTGEWGFGISIRNGCENIIIKNIILKNCWGDGLYINGASNIKTENIICDNNRRQGLSIISVDSYHSINDKFINTNGIAPESGVDIEPNNISDTIKNVIFDNPYTNNNKAGISLYLQNLETESDITINNHYEKKKKNGLFISKNKNSKGRIIINNPYYINNKENGISLRNCYNSDCKIIINKPYIMNFNTEDHTSRYIGGISIYTLDSAENYPLGNIEIVEPYFTCHTQTSLFAIYFGDQVNDNTIQNITLKNIIYKQSNLRVGGDTKINNFILEDINNILKLDVNSNISFEQINYYSLVTNSNYTSSRINTLTNNFPIGQEITFRRTNSLKNLTIKLDAGLYCYLFNNTEAPQIKLTMGSSITMKRVSDTEFIVTNLVGTYEIIT